MKSIFPLARSSAPMILARVAVDAAHAPLADAFDEEVACGFGHASDASMTRTAPSRRKEIGEDEAVTLDDHAAGDRERRIEHRSAIGERMKFTALAAGIDV